MSKKDPVKFTYDQLRHFRARNHPSALRLTHVMVAVRKAMAWYKHKSSRAEV